MDGFAWTDYIKLYQPDRLHMDGKGLLEDMLRDLRKSLQGSQEGCQVLDALEHALDNGWQPGVRPATLPRGALYALDHKITAREIVMLAKCLVAPLSLTHPGPAQAIAGMASPLVWSKRSCHAPLACDITVQAWCWSCHVGRDEE